MRSRSKNTVLTDGFKFCPECGTDKPESDFPIRNTGKLYAYCKPCNSARTKKWSAANKERKAASTAAWVARNRDHVLMKAKEGHYRRSYGISLDEALAMLKKQNSRCAICCTEVSKETMVVDHCHGSSQVREILCNLCNISLAPLERPEWLKLAMAYLERHRSEG